MGIFDRLAEQAAQNQAAAAAPAHAPGGEAAPVVLPPPAAAAPAGAPGGEAGPDVTALAPEVVDQRISRTDAPTMAMPAKPAELETGAPAAPGGARAEMGEELGHQTPFDPGGIVAGHAVDETGRGLLGTPTEPKLEEPPAPELPKELPTEPVPQIASKAEGEAPPPIDEEAMRALGTEKVAPGKKEPAFGEKLGALAKKFGVPLLHLLQAGAYGYAGIDKKTALQEIQERQHELKKTREGQAFLAKQQELDHQFARTLTDIQARYQQQAALARTDAEKQAAALQAQNEMERLKLDAAAALERAKIQQRPTLFSIAGGIPGLGGTK